MTLREKFREYDLMSWRNSENEIIADNYAKSFLTWAYMNCFHLEEDTFKYKKVEFTIKELLEIYKKEKGL